MNLIGPKSIASKLHLVVRVLFFLAIARVLIMSIAPVLPYLSLQHLSFDVRSGPLFASFPLLQGGEAKWWIWAMELVSRICHAVVLYLLVRVLKPVGTGELFHLKMPTYLRMMGCVVILSSILRTIFCAALLKLGTVLVAGTQFSWAIDTDAIFMGTVLVVLGEVFRSGYALKTESELTV
ncbi:MAG: DUF2975 domain-containing protein [Bryobacteraceae bacterium]